MLRYLPFVLLLPAVVAQTPVNLSAWTAESYQAVNGFGAGLWTVAPDNLSVNQSVNGQPTMFYSDVDLLSVRIDGQLTVNGTDNDYVGLALGFQPGDSTNPNADYLLVDWKRGTQSFNFGAPSCTAGSIAYIGLAVSRVEGIPTADEFWGHVDLNTAPCSTPSDKVTELQRAANLGSTGWVRGQTYTFEIEYTPIGVRIWVDGSLEIDVAGSFGNGRLAFYNFSQAGVVYNAFRTTCIASWSNYGTGHPGTSGVPVIEASANPVLGTQIDIGMTGSAPAPDLGVLVLGFVPANTPTGFGGNLLLNPASTTFFPVPPAPIQVPRPFAIPQAGWLCGIDVLAQFAHFDSGASHGIAFSRGLTLSIGN